MEASGRQTSGEIFFLQIRVTAFADKSMVVFKESWAQRVCNAFISFLCSSNYARSQVPAHAVE
jgi:hypothetical protein